MAKTKSWLRSFWLCEWGCSHAVSKLGCILSPPKPCFSPMWWIAWSARSLLFLDKTYMVLLREHPYPGLLNEPPHDSLDLQSPNSPLASLWIGSGRQTWKSYFHYTISNSCCCHTATTIHQCLACIPLPQPLHNISIFTKCLMKTPKKLLEILQSKHQKTHTVSWIPITD